MILHGDCREVMATLKANSIDAIVSDPPYGLSFMGKGWDHGVPGVEFWVEALRVAKPGAHLLAFGGTRTYHRLACAIEDAGWEVRDCIAWVYGSGFPKSHDVSKAIDKQGGDALAWQAFSKAYAEAVSASEITHSDIDRALGVKSSSCYWARTDNRGGMPPRHHWEKVRKLLSLPAHFAQLYDEAEREVVGTKTINGEEGTAGGYQNGIASVRGSDISIKRQIPITAPATDAAKQWSGWGTALKPAYEPIIVARKPLVGTVASNVMQYGTGGINVDGCRVPGEKPQVTQGINSNASSFNVAKERRISGDPSEGRWPANFIHDGSDEVMGLFPETKTGAVKPYILNGKQGYNGGWGTHRDFTQDASSGSAARFFYCAKASKADRDGSTHPTMKPTDLMRYLCRLVTPPGGTVLDPFCGSGSTGKGAILEGFNFIGIEREAEYVEIAKARTEWASKQRQPTLFD